MTEEPGPSLLRRAARRAENDPFYMASALSAYKEAEELDDAALARFLGCSEHDLLSLALCRRPGLAPPAGFGEDITSLVNRFPLDAEHLVHLVRRAEFLDAMRQTAISLGEDQPQLLAAEDREPRPDQDFTAAEASTDEGSEGDNRR